MRLRSRRAATTKPEVEMRSSARRTSSKTINNTSNKSERLQVAIASSEQRRNLRRRQRLARMEAARLRRESKQRENAWMNSQTQKDDTQEESNWVGIDMSAFLSMVAGDREDCHKAEGSWDTADFDTCEVAVIVFLIFLSSCFTSNSHLVSLHHGAVWEGLADLFGMDPQQAGSSTKANKSRFSLRGNKRKNSRD